MTMFATELEISTIYTFFFKQKEIHEIKEKYIKEIFII